MFPPLMIAVLLTACATPQPDPRFVKLKPAKPVAPITGSVTPPPIASHNLLEDRIWQLIELTKSTHASQIQDGAFLNLQSANAQVKGSTGCNRLMGSYVLQGQTLKFNDIASTKMFCPRGGIVQEAMFIEALTYTQAWRIEGQHLYLLDNQQGKVAVFEQR